MPAVNGDVGVLVDAVPSGQHVAGLRIDDDAGAAPGWRAVLADHVEPHHGGPSARDGQSPRLRGRRNTEETDYGRS